LEKTIGEEEIVGEVVVERKDSGKREKRENCGRRSADRDQVYLI